MARSVPLTILVVDDEEDMRELMLGILAPDEHLVFAAESAEEALHLLPYHTFDLALLDHNLPGMEGLVLGEYLSRNNPDMEVALVTGDPDPRLPRLGASAGLSFLAKPFDVRRVHELVGRARARVPSVAPTPLPALAFPPAVRAELARVLTGVGVPERLVERLTREARERLHHLRRGPDEAHRTAAYACLVALAVLGQDARTAAGRTLFAEYDEATARHGAPPVFGGSDGSGGEE